MQPTQPNYSPPQVSEEPTPQTYTTDPTGLLPTHQLKARIVSVPKVYHQLPGEQPFQVEIPPYSRWIESEEQPYPRTLRVTEKWEELDFGWLGRDKEWPGLVVVRNLESPPSAEEVMRLPRPGDTQRDFPGLVAVGILSPGQTIPIPFTLIPAGEHCQIIPVYGYRYHIRVPVGSGTSKVTVTALPS